MKRSQLPSRRRVSPRLLRIGRRWAVLPLLLIAGGCHGGPETDIIQRELRLQEDKIYAMEDYLSQYQQLLRQCRVENEGLKRELAERANGQPQPPSRPPTPSDASPRGPRIEVRPQGDGPTAPEIEIELPDVPPLEATTQEGNPSPRFRPHAAPVVSATHLETVPHAEAPATEQVWLHGEVVANDAGGGPRLVVDVAPLSAAGRTAQFAGRVSLMLLANEQGPPRSLARWDFSAAQAAASREEVGEPMRFYLEMPSTGGEGAEHASPATPTEIWVRLLPEEGGKLLASAPIDLEQPSLFSSQLDKPAASTAEYERLAETRASETSQRHGPLATTPTTIAPAPASRRREPPDVTDGGWTVAQPGQPKKATGRDGPNGQWRISTQPVPTPTRTAAMAASRVGENHVRQAAHSEPVTPYGEAGTHLLPPWSPEPRIDAASSEPGQSESLRGPAGQSGATSAAASPVQPTWSPSR